jgi:hypothetical protein
MRYTKEQINERFQLLQPQVQNAVLSIEVAETIKSIAQKHQLHIDTTGTLNEEITYVMVGAEKATDFIKNLKMQLKLPDEKANAIAKDVNEKVFLKIRKLMMESTQKPETKVQQEPKAIHHTPLFESEGIKEQLRQQQVVKPVVAPPSNLPTQPDSTAGESSRQTGVQVESTDEQKKPSHVDPYREPIE